MNPNPEPSSRTRSRWRRSLQWLGALLVVYLLAAYVLIPFGWRTDEKGHLGLAEAQRITRTANDIPGDPINIAVVGSPKELVRALTQAGWFPADPITFDSSVRIAVDSVFRRPDVEAPISPLFLFGRKQDLAFEQPIGNSPRQRHHVRFWRWDQEEDGRTVWFGSATLDERVGLSHTTGQITHHIGPDVDAERDRLAHDLQQAGQVQKIEWKDHFQRELQGRNGGGDPWRTDGRLEIVYLKPVP